MVDPFRLDGETALVTGGSRGIGHAIARSLAGAGASVMLCGRDTGQGQAAAAQLAGLDGRVEFTQADVTDEQSVAALIDRCSASFGGVSVLVNNAGPTDLLHTRTVDGPLGRISPDNWLRVQHGALTSVYLVTRGVLQQMMAARRGSIVNISSIAAVLAMPGFDSYAAGKAGVEALTRSVASGYGHLGIRSNAVRVGTIRVDHDRGKPRPKAAPAANDGDPWGPNWRQASPPPAGEPEDVAHAVRYLASGASRYVNGVTLPVDGGLGARSLLPWQTPRPEMDTMGE